MTIFVIYYYLGKTCAGCFSQQELYGFTSRNCRDLNKKWKQINAAIEISFKLFSSIVAWQQFEKNALHCSFLYPLKPLKRQCFCTV